jgi:hypothetical protein
MFGFMQKGRHLAGVWYPPPNLFVEQRMSKHDGMVDKWLILLVFYNVFERTTNKADKGGVLPTIPEITY